MNSWLVKGVLVAVISLFTGVAAAIPYEFDYAISKQLRAYLATQVPSAVSQMNPRYEVVNGVVLLTGVLPNKAEIEQLGAFAKKIPNVKRVENDVTVGRTSISQQKIDNRIERDLAAIEQRNHFVRAVASQGVAYLLGFVTRAEKDSITAQVQRVDGLKRIVLLFEYIDTPEQLTARESSVQADLPDDPKEDEEMTRDEALSILAGAVLNQAAKQKSYRQNRIAPEETLSPQPQRTNKVNDPRAQERQITGGVGAGTSFSTPDSSDSNLEYDQAVSECVVWERHPTLKAYKQFRNTCGFEVYVLRCMSTDNIDGCANRQWGSFTLKPYATDISTAKSVKWMACRAPYVALGSKVTLNGDRLSVPCQKRKS